MSDDPATTRGEVTLRLDPVRRARQLAPGLALCLAAAALAACTSHKPSAADPPGSSMPVSSSAPAPSSPQPVAAVARAQEQPTSVISGSTDQQLSIAASVAFFASAPVVVVAAGDAASVASAAAQAERLGVPMLIDGQPAPASPGPAATSPAAPSPAAPSPAVSSTPASKAPASPSVDAALRAELVAELHRLGCEQVLAVGRVDVAGVPVVTDPARLLPVVRPDGLGDTAALAPAGSNAAGVAAAVATARAAGASVVGVHGNDPRADRAAIDALAAKPFEHVVGIGAEFGPAARLATQVAVASTGAQLPGGGQVVFPGRRFVAMYGHPSGPALGILGAQGLDASIARVRQLAAAYDPLSDVPVVPTFEIIATVAQGSPGRDGNYSGESTVESLRPWVEKAQAEGLYVVLDLQPGRADILDQAKLYAPLLQLPNVGLAIDPEWALKPNQLPLHQIGSIDASRINAVGQWLDGFTASKRLPQKLLVLHQFRLSMIGNEAGLKTGYDNVALLIHMDGQGTPPSKDATWRAVVGAAPKGVPFGWKDFTKEDHPMLTPEQTMARTPKPMMISYQ